MLSHHTLSVMKYVQMSVYSYLHSICEHLLLLNITAAMEDLRVNSALQNSKAPALA